jgi:hypothetical protein
MSLRAIDMQVALHKNDEAGLRQNQMTHKPEQDQAALAEQSLKTAEREAQMPTKLNESAKLNMKQEASGKSHKDAGRKKSGRKAKEEAKPVERSSHPYKGHHIDLSL